MIIIKFKYLMYSVMMCCILDVTASQADPPFGNKSLNDYYAGKCQIYPYSISPYETRWVLPRCSYEAQYNKELT
jgi:hypothetical protein